MSDWSQTRINFACQFSFPEFQITLLQIDRELEALLRIRVVPQLEYGSDLWMWSHGGWSGGEYVPPVWPTRTDPWSHCEYWGPLVSGTGSPQNFCGTCGTARVPGGRFCGECGASFVDNQTPASIRHDVLSVIAGSRTAREVLVPLIDSCALSMIEDSANRILLRERLESVLGDTVSIRYVDGVRSSPGENGLTLALAQDVSDRVRSHEPLTPGDHTMIRDLLSIAPVSFGYWGPLKNLLKNLNPSLMPDAFGLALSRVTHGSNRESNPHSGCENLDFIADTFAVPSTNTRLYMERRARRDLATLAEIDTATYCRVAASFLQTWDSPLTSVSYLAGYILFGGARYMSAGSRSVLTRESQAQPRYAHPDAWREHAHLADDIISSVRNSTPIYTFAHQVLRAAGLPTPALNHHTIRLALLSTDETVAATGYAAVGNFEDVWPSLEPAVWERIFTKSPLEELAQLTRKLLERSRIQDVANAAATTLNFGTTEDLTRQAYVASIYLAYSMPNEYGYRPWPAYESADIAAVRVLALAYGFDQSPDTWRTTLAPIPLATLLRALIGLVADPGISSGTFNVLRDLIVRPVSEAELVELAAQCLESGLPSIIDIAWPLIDTSQQTAATLDGLWAWLKGAEIDEGARRLIVTGLLAKADPDKAAMWLSEIFAGDEWDFNSMNMSALAQTYPQAPGLLWGALAAADPASIEQFIVTDPNLIKTIGDWIDAQHLEDLSEAQQRILAAYLAASPTRITSSPDLGVKLATTPLPDLQRLALDGLEAAGLMHVYWMRLAESALPLPLAAAKDFISALPRGQALTDAVLAAIDSQVAATRDLGLSLLDRRRDDLDLQTLLGALTESDDPVVQARVAEEALAGQLVSDKALIEFDRRVLITRRMNRNAKEQVKERVGGDLEKLVALIEPQRLEALLDMSDGANTRDREWALQRLAALSLAGADIEGVEVQLTTIGATL